MSRAFRYSDEKLFRNLVELCLQFDLDNYEKSRALEGLLLFQCKHFLVGGDLIGSWCCTVIVWWA